MNHQTSVSTQKLCQHEDRHGETLPFQTPVRESGSRDWLLRCIIADFAAVGEHRFSLVQAEYERRLALIVRAA